MLVRAIMKTPVCVQAEETLVAAARKLKKDNIGCLPVCQGAQVIGILTDRDITIRGVAEGHNVAQMTVRAAMSAGVLFCFDDDPIEQAAALMSRSRIHRLVVLDRRGQHMVGVVSMSDLSGGGSERRPYEVSFYKIFCDHYGRPHHVELLRITVAQGTKEAAIAAAIRQFEQAKQIKAWKQIADGYDVISVHRDAQGVMVEEIEITSEREAQIQHRARNLLECASTPKDQDTQFSGQVAREIDREDRAQG